MARRYSLYSPNAMLRRKVLRESRRGNRAWQSVAGAIWLGSVMRRALARREEPAAVEHLKPGEGLIISTIPPPSQPKGRRKPRG